MADTAGHPESIGKSAFRGAEHIVQGQSGKGLNLTGRGQAQKTAVRLKNELIDAAYISDQQRAMETSQYVLAQHPTTRIEYTAQLRERQFGDFPNRCLWALVHIVFYCKSSVIQLSRLDKTRDQYR
ncbi:MAG: histidine phosphatase family protein, partial [Acidobacteria bacterium]|nr:histidine phosphatase family protein [Acidobacteriota bacterium]